MDSFEELDLSPQLLAAGKAAHRCALDIHHLGAWISLTIQAIEQTKDAPPGALDYHCSSAQQKVAKLAASAAILREGLKPVHKVLIAAIPGKKKVGPHHALSVHHGVLELAESILDCVLWHANTRSPDFHLDEATKKAVKENWISAAKMLAKEEYIHNLQDTIDEALPLIVQEVSSAEPLLRRDLEAKAEVAKLAAECERLAAIEREQTAEREKLAAEKRRLEEEAEARVKAADSEIENIPAEFRDRGQETGHPLTVAYLSSNPDWLIPGHTLTREFGSDSNSRLKVGRGFVYRYDKALQLRDQITRSNRENIGH